MATKKAVAEKSAAKKITPKKSAGAETETKRGRTCQHSGKKLYILTEKKANPRREGTNGHASFAVIKDGMTYEKFIEAGGRLVDLDWDISKGNIEVK